MDKQDVTANQNFEGLTAHEIWVKLYNKELKSKKNILEYIDLTRILKKQNASDEQLEETYNYIYKKIDALSNVIKPNTSMYLKNCLKAQLGKYAVEKDPKPINEFMEFFKEAYPENNRRKDFTWVLMDIKNISLDQAWNTLTYINRLCINDDLELDDSQKKDIIDVIKNTINKNDIKYVNNIRSLKKLNEVLDITIVKAGDKLKVKHNK